LSASHGAAASALAIGARDPASDPAPAACSHGGRANDFVYETADSIHSFETMPGDDVIVFTMLNGNLEFLDDDDRILHIENRRTGLNRHMRHCAKLGIPCPDVTSFIES
jgi:hypothetical protein